MPQGIIEMLNFAGLGLLAVGLGFAYNAFAARGKALGKALEDISDANKSLSVAMTRRESLLDKRFEDEVSFRELYLDMLKDSQAHIEKVKAWRDGEIAKLTERLKGAASELDETREEVRTLMNENNRPTTRVG